MDLKNVSKDLALDFIILTIKYNEISLNLK